MEHKKMKLNIIQAGYKAVHELIKVAEEKIILNDPNEDLAADRLKNAAATIKLAIFDAFEIVTRLESDKNVIDVSDKVKKPFKGFAERRSK